MIYIHCQNLGLREEHIKTINILDAKAEHFSWLYKLSTEPKVYYQYTATVEMPDSLANELIGEWVQANSSEALHFHVGSMRDQLEVLQMWREHFEYSVQALNANAREYAYMPTEAYMASSIEVEHLDNTEQAIFDLLNQIDFPRWAEVEI
jgi:hypothetical protein